MQCQNSSGHRTYSSKYFFDMPSVMNSETSFRAANKIIFLGWRGVSSNTTSHLGSVFFWTTVNVSDQHFVIILDQIWRRFMNTFELRSTFGLVEKAQLLMQPYTLVRHEKGTFTSPWKHHSLQIGTAKGKTTQFKSRMECGPARQATQTTRRQE